MQPGIEIRILRLISVVSRYFSGIGIAVFFCMFRYLCCDTFLASIGIAIVFAEFQYRYRNNFLQVTVSVLRYFFGSIGIALVFGMFRYPYRNIFMASFGIAMYRSML